MSNNWDPQKAVSSGERNKWTQQMKAILNTILLNIVRVYKVVSEIMWL